MSPASRAWFEVFRPGWRWQGLITLLGITFTGSALVFALLAAEDPWLWALVALSASLGITMLIRVPLVRLAYDDHTFLAAGVLWSRRIELDQIDEVDVAPEAAVIHWTSNTGRARTTPLTAVNAGRLGWLPNRARHRRLTFLRTFDS